MDKRMVFPPLRKRHMVNLDEETFNGIKLLAGDVPVARFLKRVIQELLEKVKK